MAIWSSRFLIKNLKSKSSKSFAITSLLLRKNFIFSFQDDFSDHSNAFTSSIVNLVDWIYDSEIFENSKSCRQVPFLDFPGKSNDAFEFQADLSNGSFK